MTRLVPGRPEPVSNNLPAPLTLVRAGPDIAPERRAAPAADLPNRRPHAPTLEKYRKQLEAGPVLWHQYGGPVPLPAIAVIRQEIEEALRPAPKREAPLAAGRIVACWPHGFKEARPYLGMLISVLQEFPAWLLDQLVHEMARKPIELRPSTGNVYDTAVQIRDRWKPPAHVLNTTERWHAKQAEDEQFRKESEQNDIDALSRFELGVQLIRNGEHPENFPWVKTPYLPKYWELRLRGWQEALARGAAWAIIAADAFAFLNRVTMLLRRQPRAIGAEEILTAAKLFTVDRVAARQALLDAEARRMTEPAVFKETKAHERSSLDIAQNMLLQAAADARPRSSAPEICEDEEIPF